MSEKFEGIKTRKFGIEIEMTGLTRCRAVKELADLFGTESVHVGGSYDKYYATDVKGRKWYIVSDSSIQAVNARGYDAGHEYRVEMNSPVLEYEDIPLLQEVIRTLRHARARTGPQYNCGTHIHIDAADYTAKQLRNLVNIFKSKEDFLWEALQVSAMRAHWCEKVEPRFVEALNREKPCTIERIAELWYDGRMSQQNVHYSNTRYRTLNLHSYFQHGHYEIRCCNASLHAGVVRSQIVLALAINNAAMTKRYCRPTVSQSDNMRYSFRVWLLDLGLIGDEFANCRMHLMKALSGNAAWRHPEDAIANRERIRMERQVGRAAMQAAEQAQEEFDPEENEEEQTEDAPVPVAM